MLRAQGFIILEDPLALCIGGCHYPGTSGVPSRPTPPSLRDFPSLTPEELEKWGIPRGQNPRRGPKKAPETNKDPWGEQTETPTCETVYPDMPRCDTPRKPSWPDVQSALKAVIDSVPALRNTSFSSVGKGLEPAKKLPNAYHETFRSADGTKKITIGCFKLCCYEAGGFVLTRPNMHCYEQNAELD